MFISSRDAIDKGVIREERRSENRALVRLEGEVDKYKAEVLMWQKEAETAKIQAQEVRSARNRPGNLMVPVFIIPCKHAHALSRAHANTCTSNDEHTSGYILISGQYYTGNGRCRGAKSYCRALAKEGRRLLSGEEPYRQALMIFHAAAMRV